MRRRSRSPRLRPAVLAGLLAVATFFLPALTTAKSAAPDRDSEFFDAAVRQLQRAFTVQRDGSHLARLFALRQLNDPDLKPVFYQIAQSDGWQVQVHAILGLAEIDEKHRIDPWLVTQVDEDAQEALVASAIDMELIGPDQMRELLEWDELPPMARLLVYGELILLGEPVDADAIAALAASAQIRVSGFGSVLMSRLGDAAALSAYTDRIDTLPRRERDRQRFWLLEAARQYEVTAASPWVRRLLEDDGLDEETTYWALLTLLELDATAGLDAWERKLGPAPSYRDQARFGLVLLASAGDLSPSAFDRLSSDRPLIRCMADVGRALSSGAACDEPMIALLDLGHGRTANWAVSVLDDLPEDQATRIRWHLIDSVDGQDTGKAERIGRAIGATGDLFDRAPDAVLRRLAEAEDDSPTQAILLLGLFESSSPDVIAAAEKLRRIGAGRPDSLALLLIARRDAPLVAKDLDMLGRIAAGGGRVSEGLQTQAAWLYLKHTNKVDQALTEIFGEG